MNKNSRQENVQNDENYINTLFKFKAMAKRGIIIFLLVFLVCASYIFADEISVISYGSSTTIIRNQDLEYTTCITGPHTFGFTQLVCADNFATIPATASKISNSCYYTNINLGKYDCNEYTLESYYNVGGSDKKITKEISTSTVLATPTFILDAQSWDGGWNTASDTAYAIWVLSKYGTVYNLQLNDAMNWLKDNRRNEPKCWVDSRGDCSPGETIKTLAYLKLANISEGNRIVNDGLAYVESIQKYTENTAWTARIETDEDYTYCNLTADDSSIMNNVFLNESQQYTAQFTAKYGTVLNMTCSQEATLILSDNRGIEKFKHKFDVNSPVDYDDGWLTVDNKNDVVLDERFKIVKLQQPCWSSDTELWSPCNYDITTYALSLGIDSARQTAGRTWLLNSLENHSVTGKYINSDSPELNTAFYLLAVDPTNKDLLDWLIYSQNNDGSFGLGSNAQRIKATTIAYLALERIKFPQKDEVLKDAEHWLSLAYTGRPYNDVLADGGQFQVLSKNAKPYLRSQYDGIVKLKNDIPKTVVYKPIGAQTITELQAKVFTIDGANSDMVSATLPYQMSGNETLSVTLQGKVSSAGNVSGYVLISGKVDADNASRNLRRVYFTIERDPVLSLSPQKTKYNAYNGQFQYLFTVDAVNVPVTCEVKLESADLTAQRKIQIANTGTVEVPITIDLIQEGQILDSGTLVCDRAGTAVIVPFDIDVTVHNKFPFQVEPSSLSINSYSKSFSIKIRNLENQPMELDVSLDFPSDLYTIEPYEKVVDAKDSVTIDFSTTYLKIENVTDSNIIVVKAFDKTYEVPLSIDIKHAPTSVGFIIGFTLIVTLLATAGFVAYNWNSLGPQFQDLYIKIKQKTGHEVVNTNGPVTTTRKRDVTRETMMDIISIMQSMDKSEQEVIARLESEGYARPLIMGLIDELRVVQQKVSSIKSEDKVIGIIQGLDGQMDVVTKVLKEKGYSENDIRDAFKELSASTSEKEKKLRKEAGFTENEKIT